jgi:hypothetical protein
MLCSIHPSKSTLVSKLENLLYKELTFDKKLVKSKSESVIEDLLSRNEDCTYEEFCDTFAQTKNGIQTSEDSPKKFPTLSKRTKQLVHSSHHSPSFKKHHPKYQIKSNDTFIDSYYSLRQACDELRHISKKYFQGNKYSMYDLYSYDDKFHDSIFKMEKNKEYLPSPHASVDFSLNSGKKKKKKFHLIHL